MVTVSSLRSYGFAVSNLKDEGAITLAENDVKFAYFPDTEIFDTEIVLNLLHALTYSLLLRRKLVVTRYGTVQKASQYTIAAEESAVKSEIQSYCCARLEAYIATNDFVVNDIIHIYDNLFML